MIGTQEQALRTRLIRHRRRRNLYAWRLYAYSRARRIASSRRVHVSWASGVLQVWRRNTAQSMRHARLTDRAAERGMCMRARKVLKMWAAWKESRMLRANMSGISSSRQSSSENQIPRLPLFRSHCVLHSRPVGYWRRVSADLARLHASWYAWARAAATLLTMGQAATSAVVAFAGLQRYRAKQLRICWLTWNSRMLQQFPREGGESADTKGSDTTDKQVKSAGNVSMQLDQLRTELPITQSRLNEERQRRHTAEQRATFLELSLIHI